MMSRLLRSVSILAPIVVLSFQTGCATTASGGGRKTIQGLFDHFKACGLHVTKVEDVVYQAVRASDGIIMIIDGAKVEIYDYNPKISVQKKRLDEVRKTGKMMILTIPVPAVVNENLVMLTYTQHPKIHEIIKAFRSF